MVIYTVDLRLSKHHALTTKLFNSETDSHGHVFNMEEKLMYTKNASAMIDLVSWIIIVWKIEGLATVKIFAIISELSLAFRATKTLLFEKPQWWSPSD